MAVETKTINMPSKWGPWYGTITVTIDNDAANGKATVTASMNIRTTDMNQEGVYSFTVYINKDGTRVATTEDYQDMYLWNSTYSCSATFNYTDSCTIRVGGWSICHSGAMSGDSVEGWGEWTIETYRPPTPIVTDKESVQMGENLLITLNRAYGDYTHTLYYKFGTGSEMAIASSVGTSYAWKVPDLSYFCTNAVSGSCTLKAITYKGSTKIGETTKIIILTVPDPTTPAIIGSEVTMGTSTEISCQRNSSNFTLKLEFEFQGTIENIGQTKTDSFLWTPSYALAKQIPALTYATGTLKCTTMNGTAEVGVKTATIRAIVPENDVTKPSFTLDGLLLSPISSLGDAFDGLYVRGKTGLKAEFIATSDYSEIKDHSITIGGLSAAGNPACIEMLINEGDMKVTGKVTDARGYSTSVSTTIHILPYRKPKVTPCTGYSSIICERAMQTGELNSSGTYLALKAGKSYSSIVVNDTQLNGCVLRYRWKLSAASEYCEWITLLGEESAESEVSLLIGNVVSSLSTSYDVEISAADTLGEEHTLTFAIMTEAVGFVLYPGVDGAGFGKYPEEPHVVDIASHMTLLVRGKLVVVGADWNSLGLADGVMESVYDHGRKKEPGCHMQVANGNHVYVAFDCAFEYAGTAVVINSTSIPEDYRPKRRAYSLCPVNDRAVAQISVDTDGYIRVEWVQKLTDTVLTGAAAVAWIDGYLDYWT